jgi:hypothetical protein
MMNNMLGRLVSAARTVGSKMAKHDRKRSGIFNLFAGELAVNKANNGVRTRGAHEENECMQLLIHCPPEGFKRLFWLAGVKSKSPKTAWISGSGMINSQANHEGKYEISFSERACRWRGCRTTDHRSP